MSDETEFLPDFNERFTRRRFNIPRVDATTIAWYQYQENPSRSLRTLVTLYVNAYSTASDVDTDGALADRFTQLAKHILLENLSAEERAAVCSEVLDSVDDRAVVPAKVEKKAREARKKDSSAEAPIVELEPQRDKVEKPSTENAENSGLNLNSL